MNLKETKEMLDGCQGYNVTLIKIQEDDFGGIERIDILLSTLHDEKLLWIEIEDGKLCIS